MSLIRILHTIDTTGPGGAETVFVNIIKELDGRIFKNFAAIRGPGWVCDALRKNGIEPIFVPSSGGFNIRYIRSLVRIIRQNKIDIVQSHLLGSNLYSSIAGLICRVPVVSTFHGFVDASATERLIWLKSFLINLGSKTIVFVSDRLRSFYIRNYGISDQKAVTIYNGVDTNVFRPKKDDSIRKALSLTSQHMLIGALGNIRPAKGYDSFLKAARIVYDKYPGCRFIISGQASGRLFEELLQLRKDLDLEKVVNFLGFRDDAHRILNNLDIFILPSLTEGFSISTIEAMACGVPVVVTRSGGPEEIISDGYNGLVVGKAESDLAKGLATYIEHSEVMLNCSRKAYKDVIERFSLDKMIQRYTDYYLQIVNN